MVNTNIGDRNLKCFELYFESMITIRIYDSIESIRSNSNSFEIFTLKVLHFSWNRNRIEYIEQTCIQLCQFVLSISFYHVCIEILFQNSQRFSCEILSIFCRKNYIPSDSNYISPYPNRIFISLFSVKFVANKTCRIFFETISLKEDISKPIERYRYVKEKAKSECLLCTFPFVGATILMLPFTLFLRNEREGCISCHPVQAIALLSTLSRRIRINLYLHTSSIIMLIVKQGAGIIRFEQTFCFRSWCT